MYEFTVSNLVHAEWMGSRLRKSDILEIQAMSGKEPEEALIEAFSKSELKWTAFKNGIPIAMFGAAGASVLATRGVPWMLGTPDLDRAVIEIGRRSRYYVNQMKRRFSFLENYVDARQLKSIRWLKWCGFTVEKPEPIGINGEPFHRFWM